jgi:hypothetical protein
VKLSLREDGSSDYGPSVLLVDADGRALAPYDRRVLYFSATSLTTGDPRQYGGCERRYYYEYVERRDRGFTAAQATGIVAHDEIASYLTTGEATLGPLALTAKHIMPTPGPDLRVEQEIGGAPLIGPAGIIAAPEPTLFIDGIPSVGKIDVEHDRCVNRGGADIEDTHDPEGTVEVLDWKTTASFEYAKTGPELLETVQMISYGESVSRRRARTGVEPRHLRLSHGYLRTKGARVPARKSTVRVTRSEIADRWESVEAVGRKLLRVIHADRAEDVDANTRACGAYRGCPHRSYCRAANHDSLSSMWGEDVAAAFESLIIDESGEAAQTAAPSAPEGEKPDMSLLNLLNSDAIEAAPDPVAAKKAAMLAEIAKIEAEEAAAEAARKAKAAAKVEVPAGFAEALDTISRSYHDGKLIGFPPIGGEAAKVYAAAKGLALEGEGYAGSGALGGTPLITDPAKIIELAKRCEAQGKVQAKAADAPLGIVPPDAPESDPAKASAGPKTVTVTVGPETDPIAVANAAAASATAGVGGGTVTEGTAEAKPKRGPGRPKKADKPADGATQTGPAAPDSEAADRLVVFVDAIPSRDYASLDGWFRELRATLCRNEGPTCVDPRLVPDSSGLAFGRWKGAISALARAKPPAPDIYVVIRPDELMLAALEGLREVADLFVVGVR